MESRESQYQSEPNPSSSWSILDGEFQPSADWPNKKEVDLIKGRSATYTTKELQLRIYYSELLIYAMRHVNPTLAEAPIAEKQLTKYIVGELAGQVYDMTELQRKEDLKDTAEALADEPLTDPRQVPVMQALREMQDKKVIDYQTRTILDSVVRGVHLMQQQDKPARSPDDF